MNDVRLYKSESYGLLSIKHDEKEIVVDLDLIKEFLKDNEKNYLYLQNLK